MIKEVKHKGAVMSEKKLKAPQELINNTNAGSLIDSPVGRLYLAASTKALTGLWYEEQTHFPYQTSSVSLFQTFGNRRKQRSSGLQRASFKHTTREPQEHFAGKRTTF